MVCGFVCLRLKIIVTSESNIHQLSFVDQCGGLAFTLDFGVELGFCPQLWCGLPDETWRE